MEFNEETGAVPVGITLPGGTDISLFSKIILNLVFPVLRPSTTFYDGFIILP